MNSQITKHRKAIDEIDSQIIDLLARRFHLTQQICEIKETENIPVEDKDREAELEAMYTELALQKGLDPEMLKRIFRKIFEEVKRG